MVFEPMNGLQSSQPIPVELFGKMLGSCLHISNFQFQGKARYTSSTKGL